MLGRLSTAISSRVVQVYQIASWRRPKLSMANADDCTAIRRHCTSIFAVAFEAIHSLSPQEVGTLSSVLQKCTLALVVFMVQDPTDHQVRSFNIELKSFILSRCPNARVHDLRMAEMASFVRTAMRLQCEADPAYMTALSELRRIQTYAEICKASYINRDVFVRIDLAMFHEILLLLCKQYSFKQMVAFTRAYRHEDYHSAELPSVLISPIEFSIDDTEAEYQGVGEHIELFTFCKPVASVPKDTSCSVCVTKIDDAEQDKDDRPISTQCGHMFHELCLDKWVNDSGMKASNTCPSCRAVLCKPRERVHVSLNAVSVDESNVEDNSSRTAAQAFSSSESESGMPPQDPAQLLQISLADRFVHMYVIYA